MSKNDLTSTNEAQGDQDGLFENLPEEIANQQQKVVINLLQKISKLSAEIEVKYLDQKWSKNLDGSERSSYIDRAMDTSLKLTKECNQYDGTVEKLKLRENELNALIAKKLKILNESNF